MGFLRAILRRTLYRSITGFILSVALLVALVSGATVYTLSFLPTEFWIAKAFLIVAVTPIAGALLVTYILRRKIASAIELIREEMDKVRTLEDLSKMRFKRVEFDFEELSVIREGLIELVDRLNRVAVDRRTFEMENRLLQGLVVSAELVRSWRDFVKEVLQRIAETVSFSYAFFVFSEPEGRKVHLFLNSGEERSAEEKVRSVFGKDLSFERVRIGEEEAPPKGCHLFVKKLERPSLGGVLGGGLCVTSKLDEEEQEVLRNFLGVLVQVVGSAKAVEEFMRQLEYYATRDPLTGLYNQRVFWELLTYEVERAKRHGYKFALLVADVDNFKVINDTYGHEFGDRVLKEVARVLRGVLRREDIVARYGGDEFVIILPYSSSEQAFHVASRMVESLSGLSLRDPEGREVRVSVSVGMAVFPDHAPDGRQLFLVADTMVYKAKEEGKGKVATPTEVDVEETARRLGRRSIQIIEAVEKGKVFPVFQPIGDSYNLKVHAYEVLMRMEGEDRIVPASEFVPLAESIGLIHKLDYIVIEKALEELSRSGFGGRLFFNLSPRALILRDFIENVVRIVRDLRIDPDRVVFEITERETVRNMELLKSFAAKLKEEGFHFAIDDFGSGFASFMYLKHLPVDYIKIEGDFIRSLLSSRMDKAFVVSITAMCRSLGIKTIAEFVESGEILEAVRRIGVDYVQGFYVGKPVRNL